MKPAVLFDLGNTLAAYYHKDEFNPILRQAISDVRLELDSLGLADSVDHAIFCGDAGWRKPANAIFELAAAVLERSPQTCVFVGDDPSWDIDGSEAVRMRAILIDRDNRHRRFTGERIESLTELPDLL